MSRGSLFVVSVKMKKSCMFITGIFNAILIVDELIMLVKGAISRLSIPGYAISHFLSKSLHNINYGTFPLMTG